MELKIDVTVYGYSKICLLMAGPLALEITDKLYYTKCYKLWSLCKKSLENNIYQKLNVTIQMLAIIKPIAHPTTRLDYI